MCCERDNMRVAILLTCLVAAVCGQTQNYYSTAGYDNTRGYDNFDYTTTGGYGNYYRGDRYSTIAPERSRYEAVTDQYNAQSAPVTNKRCVEKNERYPVSGSCDRYIECLNGTAEEKLCPDGLRYNPNVKFNIDPCQYPIDVPCLARSSLQPAQPTDDCPHQFGYFKTGDSKNCGTFRNCVNGVGYDFDCPEGLAFSPDSYRCEWPDEVKECDVEAFLGFRCPEIPVSKELGPPVGYRTYRSPNDCQKYFLCINGKPRRLSCSGYAAYDQLTESCVAADEIAECPAELRTKAAESRDAEKQRLAAEELHKKQRPGQLRYTTTDVPESYQKLRYGQSQRYRSYTTTELPDYTQYGAYESTTARF